MFLKQNHAEALMTYSVSDFNLVSINQLLFPILLLFLFLFCFLLSYFYLDFLPRNVLIFLLKIYGIKCTGSVSSAL